MPSNKLNASRRKAACLWLNAWVKACKAAGKLAARSAKSFNASLPMSNCSVAKANSNGRISCSPCRATKALNAAWRTLSWRVSFKAISNRFLACGCLAFATSAMR